EDKYRHVPVQFLEFAGQHVAGGVAEIPDHDLGVSFAQADQVLQYLYHHVFVEHVQEQIGNDQFVMLKHINFHEVAVNAMNGEVRRFCLLGITELAEHGFRQVNNGDVGAQLGRPDGIAPVAHAGKQNTVTGLDGFHVQHGCFAVMNIFAAVEVAQKIVNRADI